MNEQYGSKWIEVKGEHLSITLCTRGASVYDLVYEGQRLLLTPKSKQEFQNSSCYYGKTLGRVGGRLPIHYTYGSQKLNLPEIEKGICLHGGGKKSFSFKEWIPDVKVEKNCILVSFSLASNDGEAGFPGEVKAWVTYRIEEGSFTIFYSALSSKDTPLSLTTHMYWNIENGENSIDKEVLSIQSHQMCSAYKTHLLKDLKPVKGFLDFNKPTPLEKRLDIIERFKPFKMMNRTYVLLDKAPQIQLENGKFRLSISTDYTACNVYVDSSQSDNLFLGFKDSKMKRRGIAIEPQNLLIDPSSLILKRNTKYNKFITFALRKKEVS